MSVIVLPGSSGGGGGSSTGPAALYVLPQLVTGRWYAHTGHGAHSAATPTLNRLFCVPVVFRDAVTLTGLGMRVTSGSGAASGGIIRLGIYNDSNGMPGSLRLSAGSIVQEQVGSFSVAISHAVSANTLYWLACVSQVANCQVGHIADGNPLVSGSIAELGGSVGYAGFCQDSITGALPDPFVSLGAISPVPKILYSV